MSKTVDLIRGLVKTDLNHKGWCCGIEGDSVIVPFSDGNVRIQISEEPAKGLNRPPATGHWEDAKGVVHRWREDWDGERDWGRAFEFRASSDWHRSANPGVKPYTPCADPTPEPEPRPRDAATRKWMRETGRELAHKDVPGVLWRWDEEQGVYQGRALAAEWAPTSCQDEPPEIFVPADGLPWGDK